MAIDPRIALGVQTPQIQSPLDSMAKVGQVRAQQNQIALQDAQLRGIQREEDDRGALDAAYAAGADRAGILSRVPGHLRGAVEKQFAEIDEADMKRQKAKTDLEDAENDYFGALAYGVKAHEYDPQAVTIALADAHAKGHDVGPIVQHLQQNPDGIKSVVDGLIARSKTYSQRAREDASQQETVRANQMREFQAATTATQAQADRQADNARLDAAQKETARHNAAIERLQAGKNTPEDTTALVDAVIENPGLFDQITPTVRGKLAGELQKRGFEGFGKPLSDSANKQIAESTAAVDNLKDLRAILQRNEQYIGPIAGLQAMNPYSEARKAQADIDMVRQRVGKALEGGVLRKEDEAKYKVMLATLRDEPLTAIYKVDQMIKMLEHDIQTFKNQQRLSGRRVSSASPSSRTPAPDNDPGGIR